MNRRRAVAAGLCLLMGIAMEACDFSPSTSGSVGEGPRSAVPQDFPTLYLENCAGCHGAGGVGGASVPLANPVYQALVDEGTLRQVIANGRPGSHMPGFAKDAGGMLSESQIDTLVHGMRQRWARPVNLNTPLPPYKAKGSGDPRQGARVYGTFCASCHGQIGQKPGKAGSIINRSFLQLIDDQSLRTLVIIGRPEFNAPDWRHDVPGHPMSEQDITDVVAWLSSQRPQASGAATRQGGQ